MKILLLLILQLNIEAADTANTPAANFRKEDYPLDDKYKGGPYLIYDCERKHYACVDVDGHELCKTARQKSIDEKTKEYACAPLKIFDEKKKCIIKNYEVMERNAWKRFCFIKSTST